MHLRICSLLIVLLVLAFPGRSQQDTLITVKGDTLVVNILEVGTKKISYQLATDVNDIPRKINTKRLLRYTQSDGAPEAQQEPLSQQKPEQKPQQVNSTNASPTVAYPISKDTVARKNAIKTHLFAPMVGVFNVGYEGMVDAQTSIDINLNIVGVFSKLTQQTTGTSFLAGVKFYLSNKQKNELAPLEGWYLKPELALSSLNHKEQVTIRQENGWREESVKYKTRSRAVLLNFGYQAVLAPWLSIDFNVGVGYGNYKAEQPSSGQARTQNLPIQDARGGFLVDPGGGLAVRLGGGLGLLF